ncbi:MAG: hypothetical protein MUW56_03760 [Chryseobacterium sp.]|uniref:hypothetical protein n=1 Tax=Chryseobacterium sp. TaxID=1871047 RepID=UPI0025C37082|nr:hypothetical protein [Chryseobacterium sp.]MCJ7932759.1 hypothetical protein [Chryseobacterium sp.]
MGPIRFRLLFSIMCFLLFTNLSSQKNVENEIDIYTKKADFFFNSYEDVNALEYAKKANDLAIKSGNSEKISKSYFLIAVLLYEMDMEHESLEYAEKALLEKYVKSDYKIRAELYKLKANNYTMLNLYESARRECRKVIKIISPSDLDPVMIQELYGSYRDIGVTYYRELGSMDSLQKYSKIKLTILKNKPEKLVCISLSEYYIDEAGVFLTLKQTDSALSNINKSYALKKNMLIRLYSMSSILLMEIIILKQKSIILP